ALAETWAGEAISWVKMPSVSNRRRTASVTKAFNSVSVTLLSRGTATEDVQPRSITSGSLSASRAVVAASAVASNAVTTRTILRVAFCASDSDHTVVNFMLFQSLSVIWRPWDGRVQNERDGSRSFWHGQGGASRRVAHRRRLSVPVLSPAPR